MALGLDLRPCLRYRYDNGQIGKIQGEGYDTKMSISQELSVQFASTLDTVYLGCALPLGGVIFMVMMSRGHMGVQNALGVLFWLEKALKPWKDTTWSVPKCFPGCPVSSILYCNPVIFSLLPCEKIDLLLFIENKSSLRKESFTQGWHHDLLLPVYQWEHFLNLNNTIR